MARSLETRLSRLEAPPGDPARSYHMLKACYQILSRLDDTPMPTDAELWAMAHQDTRPDYTAGLVSIWEQEARENR